MIARLERQLLSNKNMMKNNTFIENIKFSSEYSEVLVKMQVADKRGQSWSKLQRDLSLLYKY